MPDARPCLSATCLCACDATAQVLAFSEFWHAWLGGWRHRWTDQTFWTHALYISNATGRVLDRTAWRTADPPSFVHHADAQAATPERD